MATSFSNRSSLRFPGNPAPVSRGLRTTTARADVARPRTQTAAPSHAEAGSELFAEVLANIRHIIRGERPVPVAG